MKKSLLLSSVALLSLSALADYTAPGYYRVKNYKTNRYVSVIDNRGHIDYANSTADLAAIQLQLDFDAVCCDPASVLYLYGVGSQYQIEAQGTGIHQIISHYLNLKTAGSANGQTLYNAYGQMNGVVKYLGDSEFFLSEDLGCMATTCTGDFNKWYITPISATSDNYFGLMPTVTAKGKNYMTLYGSFPYSAHDSGIKSYYISTADHGMAVMTEIDGVVPASTPVIIETPTTSPATNRVNVGGSAAAISGNKLGGVYFNNPTKTHNNRVAYDKNTMRVLGTCSDGSLGFVTSETLDYIPKNTAYLKVAAGSPAEFKCVTQAEYDAYVASIPTGITLSQTALTLTEGDAATLTATITPAGAAGNQLTWTSSNAAVATVNNGVVTAVAPGTATITAKTTNGLTATCTVTVNKRIIAVESITLNPTAMECTEGDSFHITATVLPENATDRTVTWTTSNAAVATVSNGDVTTVAPGTATITATTANGLTATCTVTVNAKIVLVSSIVVAPASFEGEIGSTCQLTATVAPADATDASVTWSSSDETVATVDANGLVTIVKVGQAVVTATANDGSGAKGECTISGQSGIEAIFAGEGTVDVYDMFGRTILRNAEAEKLSTLPAGMYIINGKKVVIR